MIHILYVCLGNICRSPTAQLLTQQWINKQDLHNLVTTSSAGTNGLHTNEPIHAPSGLVLKKHNIAHEHFRSQQLTRPMLNSATYVVVMEQANWNTVRAMGCTAHKVFYLTQFSSPHVWTKTNVPDPWYTSDYEQTYQVIADACHNFWTQMVLPNLPKTGLVT